MQYSALEKAIDMAAHNFAHPLFDMDAMEGEMKMVDSEFKMKKPDDYLRQIQVLKEISQENHIFRQFAWGNLKSLQDPDKNALWQDLKKFYDDYEVRFCVKVLIQEETVLKPVHGFIQPPKYEVLLLAANLVLAKD